MFKKNVGNTDRIIRIVIGLVLIILTIMGKIGFWGWIGIIPLATGIMSSCMLYTLLGINTNKLE
ncbi:MAG: hypothetical protein CSA10_00230 [Cardiobacteriales bacterium]|nr:MAG: hypothetical protein CSA10_00230 [Cardiobacteriales bacterium]